MLSQEIEKILSILEKCKSDFQLYEKQLKKCADIENDILHSIEGIDGYEKNPPKYKERAALATQLQKTLISRREAKDNIRLYQSVIDFINSDMKRQRRLVCG